MALEQNNDLKIAAARVAEARASAQLTGSALFPQIDARASGTRGTLGGTFGERTDLNSQRGISGTWELDLFGAIRRRNEAAEAAVEAAESFYAQTRIELVAQVAQAYIQYRSAQEQERLTRKNLELQTRSLNVTEAQRNEQVVSDLDLHRAQAQVHTTESRLPRIHTDRYAALNRLATLLSIKIRDLESHVNVNSDLPDINVDVRTRDTPFDTIRRRPDIRAAEYQLIQATALKAAALADFYPRISLDGFFGAATSTVFGNMDSWRGTVSGILPLLNFGRLQGQLGIADARKDQAFFAYQQAVLKAVEEVENSLYAYRRSHERAQLLATAAKAQARAANVAREQYIAGIGQQLDLLDAERGALDAEIDQMQARAQTLNNLVQLYTALGLYTSSTFIDREPLPTNE